ncbi:LLM class oxidoreductase [Celerinatantimonas sp. YJH-8]|uniref:LLM class oxidoreductase n=1 Tax=Celerinatantimonas sp. YJH-8 TaxID=3228714 RepID=UPI0038C953E5
MDKSKRPLLPTSFQRVFSDNQLSIGLLTPLEAYPSSPFPSLKEHLHIAQLAEQAGFASIWVRDVPFYDPNFGDAAQILDPFVYAGYLSAVTHEITLGTAGIVLPLRDPISVAKQSASVDWLTGGRFVLGLSTGDRAVEYPAFGIDFDKRAELYRESVAVINQLHREQFPQIKTQYYGHLSGNLDLHPKPVHGRLPIMAVGRSRQPIEWLAKNVDAWIWSVDDERAIQDILGHLKEAAGDGPVPQYGYATFFDLDANPNAPYQRFYNVVRIGRNALVERLMRHRELGVRHIALNLKPSRRPAAEVIAEMGEYVLPALL